MTAQWQRKNAHAHAHPYRSISQTLSVIPSAEHMLIDTCGCSADEESNLCAHDATLLQSSGLHTFMLMLQSSGYTHAKQCSARHRFTDWFPWVVRVTHMFAVVRTASWVFQVTHIPRNAQRVTAAIMRWIDSAKKWSAAVLASYSVWIHAC